MKTHFRLKKIYYVTEGAEQNFKNKSSFANLQGHEEDFGIPAEWHFHSTSHVEAAYEGIEEANIKRQVAHSGLQYYPKHHMLTPQSLFHWAKKRVHPLSSLTSSRPTRNRNRDRGSQRKQLLELSQKHRTERQ